MAHEILQSQIALQAAGNRIEGERNTNKFSFVINEFGWPGMIAAWLKFASTTRGGEGFHSQNRKRSSGYSQ